MRVRLVNLLFWIILPLISSLFLRSVKYTKLLPFYVKLNLVLVNYISS